MARPAIRDFGFDPGEAPYHFSVVLRAGESPQTRIVEHYMFSAWPASEERKPEVKAILDGYRWSRIEAAAQDDFNQRLAALGYRPAAWHSRETLLAPYLGKELVLLAWAVEDADPTVIPNIIANWRGLAPEERWWLYTTVNATSGHPEHGRDRGWRKAIKIALAENPADTAPPGTISLVGSLPPASKKRRKAREEPDTGQLLLTIVDEAR